MTFFGGYGLVVDGRHGLEFVGLVSGQRERRASGGDRQEHATINAAWMALAPR
jgi:hypothetical protein